MIKALNAPDIPRPALRTTALQIAAELVLIIICLLPGMYFSYTALQEPWTMFRVARANISLGGEYVADFVTAAAGYRGEHIGGEMVQIALVALTRSPLEAIGLLPVGSLIIVVGYYAAARVVAQSRWTPALTAVFVGFYYPGLYSQFATQTYAWTHMLFLCVLILLWHWLHQRRVVYAALIMLLFTVTFLHYHTTPIWIISVLAAAVVGGLLSTGKAHNWSLPAFCAVLFLSFDTVVYGNGLARLVSDSVSESFLQSLVSKVIGPLFTKPPALGPYEIAPLNSRAATWSTLAVLLLLTVPVGLWCLNRLYRAARVGDVRQAVRGPEDIFVWSIVVAAVVHMLMYSLYGAVSIRVVQVGFPIILPLVVRGLRNSRSIEAGGAAALAVAAVIGFSAFAPSLRPSTVASETGIAAGLIPPYARVLGDANTYGALLLNASDAGKVIDFAWLTPEGYQAVVGEGRLTPGTFDYVAVEHSGNPVITANWRYLEPWDAHIGQVEGNPALSKIYDSEHLSLFQPAGAPLSAYAPAPRTIAPARRPGVLEAAAVSLAVAMLLLPGLALLLALRLAGVEVVRDRFVSLAVAVGLGLAVVTLAGYVANFTPLTLGWFLPLVALIPLAALAAGLALRAPRPALRRELLVFGAGLALAIAAWSGLAVVVEEARAERHGEYAELFVTRSGEEARAEVHVVSRLSAAHEFQLVYVVDGVERARGEVFALGQYEARTAQWDSAIGAGAARVELILERDGEVYHRLSLSQP